MPSSVPPMPALVDLLSATALKLNTPGYPTERILADLEPSLAAMTQDARVEPAVRSLYQMVQKGRLAPSAGGIRASLPGVAIETLDRLAQLDHGFDEGARHYYATVKQQLSYLEDKGQLSLRVPRQMLEREQAIPTVLDQLQRYEAVLRDSQLPLSVLVADKPIDSRVLLNSQSFLSLLGYTEQEVRQLNFEDLFVPEDRRELKKMMIEFPGTGFLNWPGARLRHKDGSTIVRDILAHRSNGLDRMAAIVFFLDPDIRLQERQHVMESERIEGEKRLIGGISHHVLNALDIALKGYEEAERAGRLHQIPSAALTLTENMEETLRLVAEHIQEISSIEINKDEKETFALASLLSHQSIVTAVGSDIKVDVPQGTDKGLQVYGIKSQIRQLIFNLLRNAREAVATQELPRISVSFSRKQIDRALLQQAKPQVKAPTVKPGAYVQLRIRDNGVGIPAAIQGQIFDPYFTTKGPSSVMRDQENKGAGLWQVRDIVLAHGGFLVMHSDVDSGTTMDIYFPKHRNARSVRSLPAIQPATFSPAEETLLYVEDERNLRRSLGLFLGQEGFKAVLMAEDGIDGLEKFQANPDITLIVTDLRMPRMDGQQLIEKVRGIKPRIPIVIASGNARSPLEKDPSIAFIQKPFRIHELMRTIESLALYLRGTGAAPQSDD